MSKLISKKVTPNRNILIFLVFLSLRVHGQISLVSDSLLGTKVWECGRQGSQESVGGQSASPWTVGIHNKVLNSKSGFFEYEYFQTGTLVGLQSVITSGSRKLATAVSGGALAIQTGINGTLFEVRSIKALEGISATKLRLLDWDSSKEYNGNLFLLHLQTHIQISATSRPICIDSTAHIFENKNKLSNPNFGSFQNPTSQNTIYISGYVNSEGKNSEGSVQLSPSKRWKIRDWDEDAITLLETSVTLFGYNFQRHENPYLPRVFDSGSALVYRNGDRWFLLGVSLVPRNRSSAQIRSIEKLTPEISTKQQCASGQVCSDTYCLPVACGEAFFCQCDVSDFQHHCGSKNLTVNEFSCNKSENAYKDQSSRNPTSIDAPNSSNENSQDFLQSYETTTVKNFRDSTTGRYDSESTTKRYFSESTAQGHESKSTTRRKGGLAPIRPNFEPLKSVTCPPINLGDTSQNIDLSCRFPNGSRAGLICVQKSVEIGSIALLTCLTLKANLQKTCSEEGFWTPPYHLDCPSEEIKILYEEEVLKTEQKYNPIATEKHLVLQQAQSSYLKDVSKEIKDEGLCPPMELHQGLQISCNGPLNDMSVNCTDEASLPGTIATIQCKPFYISTSPDPQLEKKCDPSGNWLPRKPFACSIDCGKTDFSKLPFVVHGAKTQSEQWPWHVALFYRVNGTYQYRCGGSLISRSIITTAAHCVQIASKGEEYISRYKVAIGAISSNYSVNLKDEQTQMFEISNVSINPHYNNRSYEGDIAILQLNSPVRLTEYVRPVCFPYPNEKNNQLERYQLSEGNAGYVVGFGTDESWNISLNLKLAKIPYVSVKECTRVLDRQPTISQYCAGYTNGTSVCEGDSGGGMFFENESTPRRFYLQGIISHGSRDEVNARCDNKKYSIYTRVGAYSAWVKSMVDTLDYDYQ